MINKIVFEIRFAVFRSLVRCCYCCYYYYSKCKRRWLHGVRLFTLLLFSLLLFLLMLFRFDIFWYVRCSCCIVYAVRRCQILSNGNARDNIYIYIQNTFMCRCSSKDAFVFVLSAAIVLVIRFCFFRSFIPPNSSTKHILCVSLFSVLLFFYFFSLIILCKWTFTYWIQMNRIVYL